MTERIRLSSVGQLPVRARHVSERLVSDVSRRPGSARTLRLGRAGGALYSLNDDETVAGLRRAGAPEAAAHVSEYGSVPELVAAHVMENTHPSSIDALLIGPVMGYLAESGMGEAEARRRTGLERRPELAAAARAPVTDEARGILLDMCRGLAARLHDPATPPYVAVQLGRIRPERQAAAARALVVACRMTMRSGAKASWPSANGVEQILRGFGRAARAPGVPERVLTPGPVGELKKKGPARPAPGRAAKRAEKYIRDDPDLRYVPASGSDLLVNRRTGRVAEVSEGGSTYVVSGDLGRPVHFLPDHVREYLGADGGSAIRVTRYPSAARASRALARAAESGARVVVLSSCALPR